MTIADVSLARARISHPAGMADVVTLEAVPLLGTGVLARADVALVPAATGGVSDGLRIMVPSAGACIGRAWGAPGVEADPGAWHWTVSLLVSWGEDPLVSTVVGDRSALESALENVLGDLRRRSLRAV